MGLRRSFGSGRHAVLLDARHRRGGVSPDGDPLVRDNLGHLVPICAAEVVVIETYLGDALEELFASSKAASEPEQA